MKQTIINKTDNLFSQRYILAGVPENHKLTIEPKFK